MKNPHILTFFAISIIFASIAAGVVYFVNTSYTNQQISNIEQTRQHETTQPTHPVTEETPKKENKPTYPSTQPEDITTAPMKEITQDGITWKGTIIPSTENNDFTYELWRIEKKENGQAISEKLVGSYLIGQFWDCYRLTWNINANGDIGVYHMTSGCEGGAFYHDIQYDSQGNEKNRIVYDNHQDTNLVYIDQLHTYTIEPLTNPICEGPISQDEINPIVPTTTLLGITVSTKNEDKQTYYLSESEEVLCDLRIPYGGDKIHPPRIEYPQYDEHNTISFILKNNREVFFSQTTKEVTFAE